MKKLRQAYLVCSFQTVLHVEPPIIFDLRGQQVLRAKQSARYQRSRIAPFDVAGVRVVGTLDVFGGKGRGFSLALVSFHEIKLPPSSDCDGEGRHWKHHLGVEVVTRYLL